MRNGIDASDSGDGMHLLPVIVISGHGKEPQDIIGAFRDGIDDFILKPLGTHGQDIGSQIHGCLERAGRSEWGKIFPDQAMTLGAVEALGVTSPLNTAAGVLPKLIGGGVLA